MNVGRRMLGVGAVVLGACGPAMSEPPVVMSGGATATGSAASQGPAGSAPAAVASAAPMGETGELKGRAEALVVAASKGDFAGAERDFNEQMRGVLPADKLAEAWAQVEKQYGRWQALEGVEQPGGAGKRLLFAHTKFEKSAVDVKIAFDEQGKVAGLFFLAVAPAWVAPSYAKADAVTEREVTVEGKGPALPGTLTLPRTPGSHAAVVLVHGSGPNDRDETVGAVRAFKDLAWGLASRGIVVLRYDKRTRVSPAGVVTAQQEVLDGAHDAIELLGKQAEVDPKRRFVIGHSQGGEQAPRIARDNPALAGVIVLAGNTRPLADLIIEQLTYLQGLDPANHELDRPLQNARSFKLIVDSPGLKPEQQVPIPLGGSATGAYFLFDRGYQPATVAKGLPQPLLVLQGERDYQVTMRDFEGWKKGLAGKKNASLRSYPGLNHMFVRGTGPSTPHDYDVAAHVDEAVVTDIATWIDTGKLP